MSHQDEAIRRKIEATIKTWRETTPEGAKFHISDYNVFVLLEDGVKRLAGGLTVANLTLAYLKLSRIYDFSKDARPVKTIPYNASAEGATAPAVKTQAVSAAEEYSEATDPNFPRRGNLEGSWEFECRKINYREQRAQRAWKERENKRLLETPPAQSTINRTKADLKSLELEKQQYALRKANQS